MRRSFFYDFSNYGTYDQLTNDGLTQWHPAFLQLGKTLDECAKKYRGFCQRHKPKPKPASKSNWGSKLLAGHKISRNKGKHKSSPGQLTLWEQCQVLDRPLVAVVVDKFIQANRAFDGSWINEV
jgi:putative transposase